MHIDNDSKAIYNKPIKRLLQTAADAALDMFVRSVITTMSAALFLAPLSWAETPGEKELQKGMEAWNRKQFAEAEPYFAEAVKTAPQNTGYHWLYGSTLLHLKKYGEAAKELGLSFSPKDSERHRSMVMQQIAACFASSQNWDKAIKAYEDLSKTTYSRFDPKVMNDLANAYSFAGKSDKAAAEHLKARRYGYDAPDATVQQCHELMRDYKTEQAIKLGENAERNGDHNLALLLFLAREHASQTKYEKAIKELAECCQTADLCADNWGEKGMLEMADGHYADAINDLNKAMSLPLNPMTLKLQGITAEVQINSWRDTRAKCHLALGEFAEALKDKNALIATKDGASNFALFASRGAIYARMNNYDKAIADFSKAIALAPTQSVRTEYKTRRNAYLSAGKLDLACADAEKVISLNPEDEDGYFFISFVHMRQLKYKKAVEDLNEAIKKDPYKRQTLYFECRADAHFQTREYKDAIADYTTAIDIDSTQPWLFGGRASSYAKTGEAPKADKDLATLKRTISQGKITSAPEPVIKESSASSVVVIANLLDARRRQIMTEASKLKPSREPETN